MQLHSGMFFRNEETVSSIASRALGSVNADAQATFEFAIRPEFQKKLQAQSRPTAAAVPAEVASTEAPPVADKPAVAGMLVLI